MPSPKRGAGLPDHLLSGDSCDLPGLDLAQPALRLLTPELLDIGIYFPLKARDEPLRDPGTLPGQELEGFGFEFARWLRHTRRLSREGVAVPPACRGSHELESKALKLLPRERAR